MLEKINGIVWGYPALLLLLGTGLFLTIRLRFPQFRLFVPACKQFFAQFHSKDSSSFRALCTALAAAAGTGNIVGVAGAISIGGPGAIFWMWVSAWIGMATKYTEAFLAVRYQRNGVGGVMWIIDRGLGRHFRPLALAYCVFGLAACFGVGNAAQINSVMDALRYSAVDYGYNLKDTTSVFILLAIAVLVWWSLRRGPARIMESAELLVPFASVLYILLCLAAILPKMQRIPQLLHTILVGAFQPSAVTGGAIGSVAVAIRVGVSRGTFSNEAGMGTSATAHAGAGVKHPSQQGTMGIMEVFIDTVVICSMTAFAILLSGTPVDYGADAGAGLSLAAFAYCCGPWSAAILCFCLMCFAIATILGWGLYAGRFLEYLSGNPHWNVLAVCYAVMIIIGGMTDSSAVWQLSELMNGLMAIPNLIALLLLSKAVSADLRDHSL